MRIQTLRIYVCLIGFLCCTSSMFAQVRSEYIPPRFAIGARASALSDSYIAEPYDLTNMYLNPAAIYYVERSSLSLNHYQDLAQDFMNENITFPVSISSSATISAGLTVNHIGYLKHNFPTDFKAIQYGIDLAYATELTTAVSIGTRISSRYGRSESNEVVTFSTAVGLFYFPTPNISYGLSLNYLGQELQYIFLNNTTSIAKQNQDRSLQIGVTFRYPSTVKQPKAIIAIANEKILEQDGLLYKVGIEYYPVEIVSLRAGYLVEPDASTAKYGVGLHLNKTQLDWAISPSRLSNRFFQVSLSFYLQ